MEIEKFNQEALLKEIESCFDSKELEQLALWIGLMKALTTSRKKLRKWLDKTVQLLIKRGKKQIKKFKGKSPKLSPWHIVQLLA